MNAIAGVVRGPGDRPAQPASPPLHPYVVLAIAILLPGFGQVVCGDARRGLTLQLFMLALGFVTYQLAAPGTSFVGRIAGGLFIYAVSIPDAYRLARLRWEIFQASQRAESPAPTP